MSSGRRNQLCLSLLLVALGGNLALSAASGSSTVTVYERRVLLMGTVAEVLVRDADNPAQLADRIIQELERQERRLSTWRRDSVLSRLAAAVPGQEKILDPETCPLFQKLDRWVRTSGGAFDPLIRPLVEVWGLRAGGRLPSNREIAKARRESGWRWLGLDLQRCSITPAMPIGFDAGAFGKGEALDRLLESFGGAGSSWMVNLGGQVLAHDPTGNGWEVAVAHPEDRRRSWFPLKLASGSLAVSGGSERDLFVNGRRIGHILDPRTGHPARYAGIVLAWAPSALDADILSTACFVMGPTEGTRWADAQGLAVLYGWRDEPSSTLQVSASKPFRARFGDQLRSVSGGTLRR